MKKKLSILIALLIVLAIALPVLASCTEPKTVESIQVVNPKTEYTVGDTIDYNNLSILVTYDDESTETKTVAQLKATVVQADLSKAGDSFYTVTYQGKVARVDVHVSAANVDLEDLIVQSFTGPEFYSEYKEKSADRAENTPEARSDFRITGEAYEVGNANKFIYRPSITALDVAQNKVVTVDNAKTTVKVFVKDGSGYSELTGEALTQFVTVDDNTYLFSKDAAGQQVKLEISVDEDEYDVEDFSASQRTLKVEFVVVADGYNVYDQTGLSVMADLEKRAWSEIWKCDVVVDGNVVKCVSRADSIKLEADDKPLCEYVDNISTVIIHNSLTIDPDNLPSLYFWTDASVSPNTVTSDLWAEAYGSLSGYPDAQKELAGSLRNGANNGSKDRDYMRVMDTNPSEETTSGNYKVNGNYAIELGFGVNVQKALYSTKKVSVSGNYNSLVTPERGTRSAGGRIMEIWADHDEDINSEFGGTKTTDPYSHWSVFQMYQSKHLGADAVSFKLKNIALSGNNPQTDDDSDGVRSAGLMLCNNYATDITLYNVYAKNFYTALTGDGYGSLNVTDGKIAEPTTDPDNTAISQLNLEGVKMYDTYSNMVYSWRSHVTVANSEMIGSGGPLFILCDGSHTFSDGNTSDDGGPTFEVDDSVLQAYATGLESWYVSYNAQTLFTGIKTSIAPVVNALGKTIQFGNPANPNGGNEYINVIAAIICEPGDLFNSGGANNVNDMRDIRGTFTQTDGSGNELNTFEMHNLLLQGVRYAAIQKGEYANEFAPIIQAGKNIVAITGSTKIETPAGEMTIPTLQRFTDNKDNPLENLQAEQAAWAANTSNMLCIYLSAGAANRGGLGYSDYAPYFGVVVQLGSIQA